jgi:hypothetical protein
MATTNEKIMKIARRVLQDRGQLPASAIAEVVNIETRDGVHTCALTSLFNLASDIEKIPNTKPIEFILNNKNVDAAEPVGDN